MQNATAPAPRPAKPAAAKPTQPFNPSVILLDPAHGGADAGAHLSGANGADANGADGALEKDATIAFAGRLRTLLAARGFTVVMTHDSPADDIAPEQRTETANRSRAAACLLLHASNGGHGVHLYTSSLAPAAPALPSDNDAPEVRPILPWDTAQAASLAQSARLSGELSNVLYGMRVPLVIGRASIPPIDSLSCPAVAVELAPLLPASEDDAPTPASDGVYQQRIAEAVATALTAWRSKLVAEANAGQPTKPATTPKPVKPAPVPKSIPIETPDIVTPPAKAPIVRRPPENTSSPATTPGPPQ